MTTDYKEIVFLKQEPLDHDLYIARELLQGELSDLSTEILESGNTKLKIRQIQNEIHLDDIMHDLQRITRELEIKKCELMHVQNSFIKCTAIKELIEQFGKNVDSELGKR